MNKRKTSYFSDNELLEKFYESGDNEWLGILLQRYTLLLLGVCIKYLKNEELAKDSVQQIFFKVINELKKYRIIYFKSWLYMVARNHCLLQLRNKNGKTIISLNENFSEENFLLNEKKEKEIWLNAMEESLNFLNEEQRTCISLFYLQKKSYNEISFVTKLSAMQVKSNIQNGKRNLKILIENKMKQQR